MPLNLPERASYDYLKKLAKERLAALRAKDPAAKLSAAQLAIAREHGFTSWRALKAELDLRRAPRIMTCVRACEAGDVATLRALLTADPGLARQRLTAGRTALHAAARHADALRLILEHGADVNARDADDNVTPLHLAAAAGALQSVRVLLEAGADVHGHGDLHESEVIGWAARPGNEAVVALLLEHGARHHIFSAMALRDCDLVQALVEDDEDVLLRRRSRFENRQTPVHASFAPPDGLGFLAGAPDYAMLALLVSLGADVDAVDDKGRSPLAVALIRGDEEATRILRRAGAAEPMAFAAPSSNVRERFLAVQKSIKGASPMFFVQDMRGTLEWYRALGFCVVDEYEDGGDTVFARVRLGDAQFTLSPGDQQRLGGVSMWFYTDDVEAVYGAIKDRCYANVYSGVPPNVVFEEDLHTPFYGGKQFSVRDINALLLIFWQPPWLPAGSSPHGQ